MIVFQIKIKEIRDNIHTKIKVELKTFFNKISIKFKVLIIFVVFCINYNQIFISGIFSYKRNCKVTLFIVYGSSLNNKNS